MKKLLGLPLLFMLIVIMTVGCSSDSEKTDANTQPRENGDEVYNLSKLIDGDTVGGFIINNIVNNGTDASFTLEGEIRLTGSLFYSEMTDEVGFEISVNSNLPIIVVEGLEGDYIHEYTHQINHIYPRNKHDFIEALSLDIGELDGITIEVTIKDIGVFMTIPGEHGTYGEFLNPKILDSGTRDYLSKGFTYRVEDGNLMLTYNNTGNTITLIKAFEKYDYIMHTEDGTVTLNDQFPKVIKAQMSEIEQKIYFTVEPIHGVGVTTWFIELETLDIYFISQGSFVKEVEFDMYFTFVILEDTSSEYYLHWHCGSGREYHYLGDRLEDDIIAQIERVIYGEE